MYETFQNSLKAFFVSASLQGPPNAQMRQYTKRFSIAVSESDAPVVALGGQHSIHHCAHCLRLAQHARMRYFLNALLVFSMTLAMYLSQRRCRMSLTLSGLSGLEIQL